jgi:mono/diheme cytochrome c family protein
MPSFRWMPQHELEAVIDYVMSLSARGELEQQLIQEAVYELTEEDEFNPQTVAYYVRETMGKWEQASDEVVVPLTREPPRTPETVADGALAFAELNCVKCHSRDGRGSKTADVGQDDWGRIAYPADLTMGTLHGGRRPIDIYRRIFAGINGTPMPAFGEPDSSKNETPEERSDRIWHLVHFVTDVIEQNEIAPAEQKIIDEAMQRMQASTETEAAPDAE